MSKSRWQTPYIIRQDCSAGASIAPKIRVKVQATALERDRIKPSFMRDDGISRIPVFGNGIALTAIGDGSGYCSALKGEGMPVV
jgi:hypothetical protein